MRPLFLIPLCALVGVTQMSAALGFDTVVSESSCRAEGFARPVRQTIVILDEAAVRRQIGDEETMRGQLEQLESFGAREDVSVRGLPFAAGACVRCW